MKKRMEEFVKKYYPSAVMDMYSVSGWGTEYTFYPNRDAIDVYTCVLKNGKFVILTEF